MSRNWFGDAQCAVQASAYDSYATEAERAAACRDRDGDPVKAAELRERAAAYRDTATEIRANS